MQVRGTDGISGTHRLQVPIPGRVLSESRPRPVIDTTRAGRTIRLEPATRLAGWLTSGTVTARTVPRPIAGGVHLRRLRPGGDIPQLNTSPGAAVETGHDHTSGTASLPMADFRSGWSQLWTMFPARAADTAGFRGWLSHLNTFRNASAIRRAVSQPTATGVGRIFGRYRVSGQRRGTRSAGT